MCAGQEPGRVDGAAWPGRARDPRPRRTGPSRSSEQVPTSQSVSVQFSSLAQSCPTLCDPMDCSTPGFLVHYQLLESTQTQEVPRHTHLQSRGSTRVPPTSRGAPFPPPRSRGDILSLRGRERIPGFPIATQEEPLSTGKARGASGSCHHAQSAPDVSVHSRNT